MDSPPLRGPFVEFPGWDPKVVVDSLVDGSSRCRPMIGTTLLGTSHISHPGLIAFESMILRTSRERWDMFSRSLEGTVSEMYDL